MKRTLIVATTSYAGMGPYVSEIVNTFSPEDDVCYFFHDYEDDFFKKNVKKELHGKSVFYKQANSAFNKLKNLLFNSSGYDWLILDLCREWKIESRYREDWKVKVSRSCQPFMTCSPMRQRRHGIRCCARTSCISD